MKKYIVISLVIAIIVIGIWGFLTTKTSENAQSSQGNTVASSTDQFDITKYNAVPQDFSWTEENNQQLGISFRRPSFWVFRGQVVNNGLEYVADFNRLTIINASSISEQQRNEFDLVLAIDFTPNVKDISDGTPEGFLDVYAPSSSSANFSKKIGDINLVKSYSLGDHTVHYIFFTKNKVINFAVYNASDAELSIVEQMIGSFKLRNEEIVAPNNLKNYRVEN